MDPRSKEELEMELDIIAGVVADLDADNTHALGVVGELLQKIINNYAVSAAFSEIVQKAAAVIGGIKSGEASFEDGYPELIALIDSLTRTPADEAPAAGAVENISLDALSSRDIEEFTLQLDIMDGLLDEISPDNAHLLDVIGTLSIKLLNIEALPDALLESANDIGVAVQRIAGGDLEFDAGIKEVRDAAAVLRRALSEDGGAPDERDDSSEKLADFLENAPGMVSELEALVLQFEKHESSALPGIVCRVETLRGQSGGLGLVPAARFLDALYPKLDAAAPEAASALLQAADMLNDYFAEAARGGSPDISQSQIDTVLSALDLTQTPAETATTQPEPVKKTRRDTPPETIIDPNNAELNEVITEIQEYIEGAEAALLGLEKEPGNADHINEIFRCFHNIKGITGFLQIHDMNRLAHNAESMMDLARRGETAFTTGRATVALEALDMVKEMLLRIQGVLSTGAVYATPEGCDALMERLLKPDETPAAREIINIDETPSETPVDEPAPVQTETPAAAASKSANGNGFIKVNTGRLDSLIDAVGELVIANAMVSQEIENIHQKGIGADDGFSTMAALVQNTEQLSKITRELQELAMSLRMVTLKNTFQKMGRVARDTALKTGIPVEFTVDGEDTELDRNVVDEISTPLVHMVRNAIDHGLETPAERLAAGKPETGRVNLSAYHLGGSVVIEVRDDGRGLDKKALLAKARDMGLIEPGVELSDRQVYELIFHPGFSTAEKVTDLSGRGVGMDVVRSNIEALRGRVDIESTPGRGCRFTIRMPLTLAIIDGMLVSVGSEQYVIPVTAIQESLRPTPEMLTRVLERGEMLKVRDDLAPLFRLHRLFDVPDAEESPCDALTLLVGDGDRRCGLLVDDLLGQQQVVIKSLSHLFSRVDGVSGGAILGNGRVALILDAPGLVRLAHEAAGTEAKAEIN